MIAMCQYRFVDDNNVPFWWVMLIVGKAIYVYGEKIIKKIYLPLNFPVNLKLL